MVENILLSFYKNNICVKPKNIQHLGAKIAVMGNYGLGDCTILTNLIKKSSDEGRPIGIFCPSNHFDTILSEVPEYSFSLQGDMPYTRVELFEQFNYGNGHIIQKMQRALGFTADIKPKGYLKTSTERKKRICLHLSTGHSAFELSNQHPRPRQFYTEKLPVLQSFIDLYKKDYQFVELGGQSVGLAGVVNRCGASITESIDYLRESEFFIGLNSGFMNVAAALEVKSIIIVNIPSADKLYLPMLSDAPISDLTWLYPQNSYLHLDSQNELVPNFSLESLEAAIHGQVYPYWKDDYLNLINKYEL
jgi:hypothetical protein